MMRVRFVIKSVTTISPRRAPTVVPSPKEPRFSESRVRRSILRILNANVLCSIATVTRGNRAHISHVYFSYSEDLEFYFLSDPRSLHCRNLTTNPSMAVTVFNSSQPWGSPGRGVQFFGTCVEARGLQATKAEHVYGKRFPKYYKYRSDLAKDSDRPFRWRFYRFIPRKVKLFDEGEFGGGVFVVAAVRKP